MDSRSSLLVIDDDEAILQLLSDSLQDSYEVRTANDVLAAADLLQEQRFDLMILDLNMPVMSGEDLLDIFRVHPGFNQTPIIVISAYPDLIKRLANARVQAVFPKPFSLEELRRAIAQTIERPPQQDQSRPGMPLA
jgi:CheY-like chemotaxis protein